MKLLILNDAYYDTIFILENGWMYENYLELLDDIIEKKVEITEYRYFDYNDFSYDETVAIEEQIFNNLYYNKSANEKEFKENFNILYNFTF